MIDQLLLQSQEQPKKAPRRTAKDELADIPWLKSEEAQTALAQQIKRYIELAEGDQRLSTINQTRSRNRAIYDNEEVGALAEKDRVGLPRHRVGVLRPRVRQRVSSAVTAITSMDPIFRCFELGKQERVEEIEDVLQQACINIDFTEKTWEIVETAFVEMGCLVRVMPMNEDGGHELAAHNGKFVGPMVEPISLRDFVAYPLRPGPIKQTRLHGHKFIQMTYEIEQLRNLGIYLPATDKTRNLTTTDDLNDVSDKPDAEKGGSIANDSDMVKMYDLIFDFVPDDNLASLLKMQKLTAIPRLHVIFAMDSCAILRVEKWDHPISPFVLVQTEKDLSCLLARNGVANDIQSEQLVVNTLLNEILHSIELRNDPPILGAPAWTRMSPRKTAGYNRGELLNVADPTKAVPLNAGSDVLPMMQVMQLIISFAEGSSQASNAISGMGNARPGTATEENIKFQGFQMASSGDVRALSRGFVQIARNMLYWLGFQFDQWAATYMRDGETGQVTTALSAEDLKRPVVVDLASDQAESMPQSQIAAAQTLLATIIQLASFGPELIMQYMPVIPKVMRTIIANLPLQDKQDIMATLDQMESGGVSPGDGAQQLIAQLQAATGAAGMGSPSASAEVGTGQPALEPEDLIAANPGGGTG